LADWLGYVGATGSAAIDELSGVDRPLFCAVTKGLKITGGPTKLARLLNWWPEMPGSIPPASPGIRCTLLLPLPVTSAPPAQADAPDPAKINRGAARVPASGRTVEQQCWPGCSPRPGQLPWQDVRKYADPA
jgi:hypothetical protein